MNIVLVVYNIFISIKYFILGLSHTIDTIVRLLNRSCSSSQKACHE